MKQLLNDNRQNRELAALMIKKQKQGGKLDKDDQQAFDDALARTNARALANRHRRSKPIDWESGKDARAESRISRATRGVKKVKKKDADKAAKAHGEKINDSQIYRLTTTGELVVEQGGLGLLAKLGRGAWNLGKKYLGKGVNVAKTKGGPVAGKLAKGAGQVVDKTANVVKQTAKPVGIGSGAHEIGKGIGGGAKEFGTGVGKSAGALGDLSQATAKRMSSGKLFTNEPTGAGENTPQKTPKSTTPPTGDKKASFMDKAKQTAKNLVKNPDGSYKTGAKVAAGVGSAYLAKKAVDAARGKDKK